VIRKPFNWEEVMSERRRGEKEEKEEKGRQQEEKSWDEKWQRDPVGSIVWASILVWAGLVLLADNLGLLSDLTLRNAWGVIFAGAGVILLLEVLVRLLVPEYRRPVIGTLIFGFILLGIGLGDLVGWGVIWALVVIAIGLSILVRGLFGRR
jgi:hypothetical protein